ncbi:similar to Saccharomyces cerevisiae YPR144C NOC4 Nucleolar protein, forms a complex with Nop14p that mediates maturation and nuclear export of 40S ribosomal subunits [Maudiozyma saulgeensis]|uniref:Similar to Saccharomyces cerevisiae YPR144C NOC4 Nucleolar protein, forms a complex with Nop14p that mediates maturation and nuclear export of 40S ribosomal subunits n=1 Tax=Maudiozyma saulgeensis TaxID=1789683 RepID=A0A1X7QWJ8_9SACH|nr:similar to Saccharomyces cerevisiae YPR144C NOC4 Nucleolar protein, forms a complex with Nop14p that mediates maturation and nuclear export of 40S ribosomal subunits [Kazachstania saulgeensis]
MSLSIDEIKAITKKITSSNERTHYNSIITLLNEFEYDQDTFEEDEHLEQKLRFLVVALFQIFKKMFARNDLSMSNKRQGSNTNTSLAKFNEWCRKIYNSFKIKLLSAISKLTIETSLTLDCLDLYMQLLELESVHFASKKDAPFFPNKTLKALMVAMWQSDIKENEIDPSNGQSANYILLEFLEKYYKPFVDIQYYFQSEFNLLLDENTESATVDQYTSMKSAAKWVTLMNHDSHLDSTTDELEVFVSNPPQAIENESKFKSSLEKNWCIILNGELSLQLYKTILTVLHKRIIPHFHTPTKLMDFLTDSYNLSNDDMNQNGIIPILALNGLFELMVKNNLEYPNFYQKLYQLLTPQLMHVKYRPRFFRLMDVFLASTHVSVHLVASFIKRLARLCLSAPPSAIVIVIPFIYNLLKKHPNCMIMIHNPKYLYDPFQTPEEQNELKLTKSQYNDPFDMEEQDPESTNAFGSSLWEMDTLTQHYHPNVASLAKVFSQPFKKMSYNMEDFLDWGYDSLLAAESSRKLKILPVLEYETFDSILTNDTTNEEEQVADKSVYLSDVAW